MALAECLRRVVLDRLQLPAPEGTVNLKERNAMQVQVSGLAQGSVVLRMERIGLSGIKNGPWEQSCDYAIVSPAGDIDRVLLIELKRTLTDEAKGLEQLRRTLPRLKHLRSLCRIDCGDGLARAEIRYALIAGKGSPRLDKQPVKRARSPQTKQHKGIEVSLHIVAKHVCFGRLWSD